ncbi:MAG: L,D-transpeptidase family protein [Chitinophagaceae bacterium]
MLIIRFKSNPVLIINWVAILFLSCAIYIDSNGQTAASSYNFIDYQKSIPKITDLLKRKQDTLMRQFQNKGLEWPAKYLYIRSFKYDSQLEVWVKNNRNQPYKLFKTYKVCALAGTLGPKRLEGDYQVPEGFYHINEFKPNSLYHLSLGLNYPNMSDRMLSDSAQPGGDIYIHGSCVTTGCIPITNPQMEELYILAAYAKNQGQDFIPVHIYPIDFNNVKSEEYLKKYLQTFSEYTAFESKMKNAFYYFEKYKQVPTILINEKGEYLIDDEALPKPKVEPVKKIYVKKKRTYVDFDEKDIPAVINNLPVYPGGNDEFQALLKKMDKDFTVYLTKEIKTVYVQVEFIIDKDGNVVNPKIIRGGNDEVNDHILDIFESMPKWKPAVRLEKNVPIKLKQTVIVGGH